jgi:hypothetical protein
MKMATVLTFPERNKGRKRRCNSMDAAGCLSLLIADRDGDEIPTNVQRIDEPTGRLLPSRSDELLFALCIWQVLEPSQKERIEATLRPLAYSGRASDEGALKLYNMLKRRW